jgi:uncharacterized damage-inducible protein DinB
MLKELILQQAKIRICEESIPRILHCISMLNIDEVWKKPNENTNSIGNLILHLEGNATQWILTTFADVIDHRNRDYEFESVEKLPHDTLAEKLIALQSKLNDCFDKISVEELKTKYTVQCFEETGVGIIIHVIEHFSYHTGQIALLTKLMTNKDTKFYEDLDLNTTNK